MKSTEFVARLAEVMGVSHTEIATVDRTLAKQGLRRIARGRSRPDVTLREGVQIVCAWAGARKLTDAAEELGRLKRYQPQQISPGEYKTITSRTTTLASLFETEESDLYGLDFIEAASWLAEQLGSEKFPAHKVWLSIEKGGAPELSCEWEFQTKTLDFEEFPVKVDLSFKSRPRKPNVKLRTSVRGPVLKWIFEVTEGA
ncbi:hypothetical protein C6W92_16110 [Roseovarius sp. A46]|uniref:hypothetical protein n=1 Tax=Roseovarius sp. A46 TaxID=2109331 RepID=UPI0010127D3D|nr:hypothetical protein [Roseovarius sp. A46]RXV58884.1 hypothetical protein C6W92_16110 [Roseovarius sp. A46]